MGWKMGTPQNLVVLVGNMIIDQWIWGYFFQTKTKPCIMAVMTSTSHMNKPLRTYESKRGRCFELRISTLLNYHVVGYNHLDFPSIS